MFFLHVKDAVCDSSSWPDVALCLAHSSVSECRESLSFSGVSVVENETERTQIDSPTVAIPSEECDADVSGELFSLTSPSGDCSVLADDHQAVHGPEARSTPCRVKELGFQLR